ncbi:hypothetical protein [Paremcibacter congregatus]|uniref:PepSY domain-containing protein n=1 Tax=Paremcibacter congregatus TaxID=2043170 RepID=UPI0030EECEB5|tara:strand:- start:1458 stop:1919 length:462 start_codon:yes stop_codon:yes gene_type:complete
MSELRIFFCCGLISLFIWATGASAWADGGSGRQQSSPSGNLNKVVRHFQEKRPPVENSFIRPPAKKNPIANQIYRHDRARDALQSGRIVSLSVIRSKIRQSFPGKIIDVRLLEPKKKSRPYLYMVKVLRKDGKLLMVKVNAATAEIVGVKGNG